jgi:hypothetical protein
VHVWGGAWFKFWLCSWLSWLDVCGFSQSLVEWGDCTWSWLPLSLCIYLAPRIIFPFNLMPCFICIWNRMINQDSIMWWGINPTVFWEMKKDCGDTVGLYPSHLLVATKVSYFLGTSFHRHFVSPIVFYLLNLFPYIPFRYIPWKWKKSHSLCIFKQLTISYN